MLAWLSANSGMIFGVLFGISEALALIPGFKSNSVFQAILSLLQKLAPAAPPAA